MDREKLASLKGEDLSGNSSHTRYPTVLVESIGSRTSQVVVHGPNGGVYSTLDNVPDGDLEAFALGILNGLHCKRTKKRRVAKGMG